MKKIIALLLLLIVIACGSYFLFFENGNNYFALATLEKANEKFKDSLSYVEVEYEVNRIDKDNVETKVNFYETKTKSKEDDSIVVDRFALAYPKIIKNSIEMKKEQPTLIIDTVRDEKEKTITQNEYLLAYDKYVPFKENKSEMDTALTLKKQDIWNMLYTSQVNDKKKNAEDKIKQELTIDSYTGGFYNLKVIPNKLINLKFSDKSNDKYIIITGEVKGNTEEMFYMYKHAEVEFIIDRESGMVVRETYNADKFKEETKESGFKAFEYACFNTCLLKKTLNDKSIEDKIEFYKKLVKID